MILDEINKANVEAIKAKDQNARSIYSVIKNKALQETIRKRTAGGELVDADMVAIIQKTIKELTEEADNYSKAGNLQEHDKIMTQKALIEKYLPQMLSIDEIKKIILAMTDRSIPTVMRYFKSEYAGKCDMRQVQDVLKTL